MRRGAAGTSRQELRRIQPIKSLRGPIVAGIPAHAADEQADILKEAVDLLSVRPSRAQQVSDYAAVLLENKTRLWFDIRIITRQIIGEEFAILKHWVDRLAQKACLTAKETDVVAVA